MAIRKQSRRSLGAASRKRRTILPLVEGLEQRLVLSISHTPSAPLGGLVPFPLASGGTAWMLASAAPGLQPARVRGASGGTTQPVQPTPSDLGPIMGHLPVASPLGPDPAQDIPGGLPGPAGYIPQQIQTAYGLSTGSAYNNNILFAGIKGDGAGQTIGIFEEGYNPAFVPTSGYGNYSTSALAIFDRTFGLPDPPSLNFFDQQRATALGLEHPRSTPTSGNYGAGARDRAGHRVGACHGARGQHRRPLHRPRPAPTTDRTSPRAWPRSPACPASRWCRSATAGSWIIRQGPSSRHWDSTILQPALAAHPNVSFFAASGD